MNNKVVDTVFKFHLLTDLVVVQVQSASNPPFSCLSAYCCCPCCLFHSHSCPVSSHYGPSHALPSLTCSLI